MILPARKKLSPQEILRIEVQIKGPIEDFPTESEFLKFCSQKFNWSRKESLAAMQDLIDLKTKARHNLI